MVVNGDGGDGNGGRWWWWWWLLWWFRLRISSYLVDIGNYCRRQTEKQTKDSQLLKTTQEKAKCTQTQKIRAEINMFGNIQTRKEMPKIFVFIWIFICICIWAKARLWEGWIYWELIAVDLARCLHACLQKWPPAFSNRSNYPNVVFLYLKTQVRPSVNREDLLKQQALVYDTIWQLHGKWLKPNDEILISSLL